MTRAVILLLLLLICPHPLTDLPVPAVTVSKSETMTMTATAYVATGHRCKDGSWPIPGKTLAVDPSVIPLGSKALVDGKEYTATDTGSKVIGRHVDLVASSRGEAISWGVRKVMVEVER
jgi:3D (Asp-Asp-Asp) domain-containing protein